MVDGRKIKGHAGSDDYPLLLVAAYFIYNREFVKDSKSYFERGEIYMYIYEGEKHTYMEENEMEYFLGWKYNA